MVDPRFRIKTFRPGGGNDFDQILIPLLGFTKQNQMITFVIQPVDLIKSCTLRNVDLAADDRVNPLFFTRKKEVDSAIHCAVIGHCQRGHTEFFCARNQRLDTAGAVKQRILGMYVQMCKFSHIASSCYLIFFALTVIGVFSVFSEIVLIQQMLRDLRYLITDTYRF